jgi:hypothetical protein
MLDTNVGRELQLVRCLSRSDWIIYARSKNFTKSYWDEGWSSRCLWHIRFFNFCNPKIEFLKRHQQGNTRQRVPSMGQNTTFALPYIIHVLVGHALRSVALLLAVAKSSAWDLDLTIWTRNK